MEDDGLQPASINEDKSASLQAQSANGDAASAEPKPVPTAESAQHTYGNLPQGQDLDALLEQHFPQPHTPSHSAFSTDAASRTHAKLTGTPTTPPTPTSRPTTVAAAEAEIVYNAHAPLGDSPVEQPLVTAGVMETYAVVDTSAKKKLGQQNTAGNAAQGDIYGSDSDTDQDPLDPLGRSASVLGRSASVTSKASIISIDSQAPSLPPKQTTGPTSDARSRFSVLQPDAPEERQQLAGTATSPPTTGTHAMSSPPTPARETRPRVSSPVPAAEKVLPNRKTSPGKAGGKVNILLGKAPAVGSNSATKKLNSPQHKQSEPEKSPSAQDREKPPDRRKTNAKSKRQTTQKLELIAEQEFRWILPNRSETGRPYLTVLQGVLDASLNVVGSGTLELYDKTGTVRKKYDWKKTMPKFTLRLQGCLAISKGRSPKKGHPCLMLTFQDRGTLIMSSTKTAVLNQWLTLLNDHWHFDFGDAKTDEEDKKSGAKKSGALTQVTTSFQATMSNQLSVAYGDHVTIVDQDTSEPGWVLACDKYGKQGMVPSLNLDIPGEPTLPPSLNASFKRASAENGQGTDAEQRAKESESDIWGHWKLDREQIELKQVLGEGSHGEVIEGVLCGKGEFAGLIAKVAVKKLKKEDASADFLKEAEVMMAVRHINLVNLYGLVVTGDPLLIVAELCPKGCLKDLLNSKSPQDIRVDQKLQWMSQICAGMVHLENEKYVHRDLAARNILFDAAYSCKVADFGMSRYVEEGVYQAKKGTICAIRWTAPEAMHYGTFSTKSDIWSFGVVMYEILTCDDPYKGMTNVQVIEVVDEGARLNKPDTCSEDLYDLLLDTWEADSKMRPTFGDVEQQLRVVTAAQGAF